VWIGVLFPKRDQINTIERITYSIALSIAETILLGLALNFTSYGIQLTSITVVLAFFTIIGSVCAFFRQQKLPDSERMALSAGFSFEQFRKKPLRDKIALNLLGVCMVAVISLTVYALIKPENNEKFSEFYVLDSSGVANDYPTEITFGQPISLIVGITNQEKATTEYQVGIFEDGTKIDEIGPVTLQDKQNWQDMVTFKPQKTGDNQEIEFILYNDGNAESDMQSLHIWLDVK